MLTKKIINKWKDEGHIIKNRMTSIMRRLENNNCAFISKQNGINIFFIHKDVDASHIFFLIRSKQHNKIGKKYLPKSL